MNRKHWSFPLLLVTGPYACRPYDATGLLLEPKRTDVPGYLIDKFEVTNGQFARFLNETGQGPVRTGPDGRSVPIFEEKPWGIRRERDRWVPQEGHADHPAVGVTGFGAESYAAWAGAELPGHDQWMKAAGGPEGRSFACAIPQDEKKIDADGFPLAACNWHGAGLFKTAPRGSFPLGVSPTGCYDMAGNVSERTRTAGLIKGGSWVSGHPLELGTFYGCVQPPHVADQSVGFRCVIREASLPDTGPVARRPPGTRRSSGKRSIRSADSGRRPDVSFSRRMPPPQGSPGKGFSRERGICRSQARESTSTCERSGKHRKDSAHR